MKRLMTLLLIFMTAHTGHAAPDGVMVFSPHAVAGANPAAMAVISTETVAEAGFEAHTETGPDASPGLTPGELFNTGNYYMEQNRYEDAIATYRELECRGYRSGPLFVNMASSHVQLDSLGMAKYYYMKARQYPHARDRARQGVDYTRSRLEDRHSALPEIGWVTWSNWLKFELNPGIPVVAGLGLMNLSILVLLACWFYWKPHRGYLYGLYTTTALGLALVVTGLVIERYAEQYEQAVMVVSQQTLHASPEPLAEEKGLAYEGYTFTLDRSRSDEHADWVHVQLSDGRSGWLPAETTRTL